jgi:hypothetical protein
MDFRAAAHPYADRWRSAIPVRCSRRSYDGTPVPAEALTALEALAADVRGPHARAVVLPEAPQSLFAGIIGSYGGISGARSALAFVGDRSDEADTWVGYVGEAMVLEATALGAGTCWVAGLFSDHVAKRLAAAGSGERVYAVSPLGTPLGHVTAKERALMGGARAKRRLEPDVFAAGHAAWPAWAQAALPFVRVAPSAMNRQPWRLRVEGGTLVVAYAGPDTPRISKRLDCGIAMLHAELGIATAGVTGRWEPLGGTDVARFVPDTA